jgi:hypothetical protein
MKRKNYNESLNPNSNYPMMTQREWEEAPWNEVEPDSRSFKVSISQTLSKSTKVSTSDYVEEVDEEDGHTYIYTEDTDWEEAYKGYHYTPLELIEEFKKFLELELVRFGEVKDRSKIEALIKECEDWVEDDIAVCEE